MHSTNISSIFTPFFHHASPFTRTSPRQVPKAEAAAAEAEAEAELEPTPAPETMEELTEEKDVNVEPTGEGAAIPWVFSRHVWVILTCDTPEKWRFFFANVEPTQRRISG